MKPYDPNQPIWANFHSLPQGSQNQPMGSVGLGSQLGRSQNEFLNVLRYYNLNQNDPDLEKKLRKIIEIQRRTAYDRSPGSNDEHSGRANTLENYLNYIFKGMEFPEGGSQSLPKY